VRRIDAVRMIIVAISKFTGTQLAEWPSYSYPVEGLLFAVAFAVALVEQVGAPIVGLALAAIAGTAAVPIADTAAETTEVQGGKRKEHWEQSAPVRRRLRSRRIDLCLHEAT
jgi:hypothetical protein